MTPDPDPDPIDELAVAASLRRLDRIAAEHPELLGPSDEDNVSAWVDTLATDEGSPMAKEPTQQVAFRLSESLVERLDRHVERMTAANPGLEFTRADAVKSLLTRALDEIEAGEKRPRGR